MTSQNIISPAIVTAGQVITFYLRRLITTLMSYVS